MAGRPLQRFEVARTERLTRHMVRVVLGSSHFDTFAPNKTGTINCGYACHTRVAAKDYIFTAYGKR